MRKNSKIQVSVQLKISLVIFGLFLSFITLEIGLRICGFVILSLQEYKNSLSLRQNGTYRIMCIGESTTQGQYPGLLEEILNQRHTEVRFSVIDKGIVGSNTKIILSQLEANLDTYKPDMVVTMMGGNDFEVRGSYKTHVIAEKPLFFKSLQIYKLLKLLYLHITAKAKETAGYKQKKSKQFIQKPSFYSLEFGLKKDYPEGGKSVLQEGINEEAIDFNSNNARRLGWAYLDQDRPFDAERLFKKTIELDPNDARGYMGLGWAYLDQKRTFDAEQLFKKALEFNPNNEYGYMGLGYTYKAQGRLLQAELAFKKALEFNAINEHAVMELGQLYIEQERFAEAEQLFKKTLELDSKNEKAYVGLETIYLKKSNNELFQEYMEKAIQLSRGEYMDVTINNYLKLKEILNKRTVRLVCVQYPMCSIKPLKKIFENQKGIIFVDNEKVFRDAVKKDGYKTYFKDMIGIQFGHCTDKGNRLLADNIANVILKEAFKK